MKYGIVGLGQSGYACARFLLQQGHTVILCDTRAEPPQLAALQALQAPLHLGDWQPPVLAGVDRIVLSPGLPKNLPQLAGLQQPIIGDIELFAEHTRAKLLGITGSNGKTTVTTLLGAMAQTAGYDYPVGGNIGVPVAELLLGAAKPGYLLELSSFQLETTQHLSLAVACCLNVSADHLDRYLDLDDYRQAKQRIFHGAQCAVYNRGDTATQPEVGVPSRISFGLDAPPAAHDYGLLRVDERYYLAKGEEALLPVDQLSLQGKHNWANALAALAAGEAFGFPRTAMLDALRKFTGLAHRCALVRNINGVAWYNDSKGTNVAATLAAIQGLASGKMICLILGGQAKAADFSPLWPVLQAQVQQVFLYGEDADYIHEQIDQACPIIRVADLHEAIVKAHAAALPGSIVLFSPACASFDGFTNYQARGEYFCRTVAAL